MASLIVTGATGGLGQAVVSQLSQRYRCLILYRTSKPWDQLRQAIGDALEGFQCDLTDESSVNAAVDRAASAAGSLYGLVHLTGGYEASPLADTPVEMWNRMLALNLTSAFLVSRAVIPHLRQAGGGRILVVSSAAAAKPAPGMAAYTVSKGALNTMVEVLSLELQSARITVNAILPTALDTPAMRGQMDRSKLIPLDRIAEAILFFLSEAGSNITGARLVMAA